MELVMAKLAELWLYDIEVLTTWWVWVLVLPAMFYIPFMLLKWVLLLCPAWLPFVLIVGALSSGHNHEN